MSAKIITAFATKFRACLHGPALLLRGGDPAPAPGTTVHYDFSTTGVPESTSSVDLVKQ
jgi:hypothetical protein